MRIDELKAPCPCLFYNTHPWLDGRSKLSVKMRKSSMTQISSQDLNSVLMILLFVNGVDHGGAILAKAYRWVLLSLWWVHGGLIFIPARLTNHGLTFWITLTLIIVKQSKLYRESGLGFCFIVEKEKDWIWKTRYNNSMFIEMCYLYVYFCCHIFQRIRFRNETAANYYKCTIQVYL